MRSICTIFSAAFLCVLQLGCDVVTLPPGGSRSQPRGGNARTVSLIDSTSILRGEAMGTTWRIVVADKVDDKASMQTQCAVILEGLESKLSHWRNDSELSQFNRSESTEPVEISQEFATVIGQAKQICELSSGAFDVTAAPLVNLWGFGPEGRNRSSPSPEEIESVCENTGNSQLRLTQQSLTQYTLAKTNSEVSLDLSGLAKGYAIDKLAELLNSHDIQNYLVEFGGELRASGLNSRGRSWSVGLERPDRSLSREIHRVVELDNMAIATSGNYRNFTTDAQSRNTRCHIIDPRTGCPVTHQLASVSVTAETAMTADAWATALMVLGPDEGFRRAQQLGLNATFLVGLGNGFAEKKTDGFAAASVRHKELVPQGATNVSRGQPRQCQPNE